MTEGLTITKTEGKVLVMHLSGMLDGQTHETLYNAARLEHEAGVKQLVLDLKELEVITSAGLGALHNIYKLFTPKAEIEAWEKDNHGVPYKSSYFKLAAAPSNIYYVLNIAGFLSNIPVFPDLPGALASFPS
ncbi:MAG TPA: STAS domain-containing protein [Anaerolineales bacterium]|nr:STAS domain-containing protein [Anaerolineales bacterium]